jgi:hypothetical protein
MALQKETPFLMIQGQLRAFNGHIIIIINLWLIGNAGSGQMSAQ